MKTELPLKQFLAEEAMRLGTCSSTIYRRIKRGKYAGQIALRAESKRTIMVEDKRAI